jgi:hypothetical protein
VLNAIGKCETGHAEVKVEGDLLRLWFVGGGNDTAKAVRVPDKEIVLAVKIAGEKEGDCSCFEGRAEWLAGVKEFEASGTATFKGNKEELKIDYPHGYDPDHDAPGEGHGH